MQVATICRQGAVRSQYVAARLQYWGIDATAYGARPDGGAVYPLTVERAKARGIDLLSPPRYDAKQIPDGARQYLLDVRFKSEFPAAELIAVPELDVTGMADAEATEAIDSYFDGLDEAAWQIQFRLLP